MVSVLIDDDEVLFDDYKDKELAIWEDCFAKKRSFSHLKNQKFDDRDKSFFLYMSRYTSGRILDGDDIIRTHGTMGWTWFFCFRVLVFS